MLLSIVKTLHEQEINLKSLEDAYARYIMNKLVKLRLTQVGYISKKYTLENVSLKPMPVPVSQSVGWLVTLSDFHCTRLMEVFSAPVTNLPSEDQTDQTKMSGDAVMLRHMIIVESVT